MSLCIDYSETFPPHHLKYHYLLIYRLMGNIKLYRILSISILPITNHHQSQQYFHIAVAVVTGSRQVCQYVVTVVAEVVVAVVHSSRSLQGQWYHHLKSNKNYSTISGIINLRFFQKKYFNLFNKFLSISEIAQFFPGQGSHIFSWEPAL